MDLELQQFWNLATATVTCMYQDGAVTPIRPGHHIDWRRLPTLAASYIEGYDVRMELETDQPVQIESGEVICVRPWVRHRLSTCNIRRGVSRWSHTDFTIFGGVDVFAFFDTPWVIRGERARRIGAINAELATVAKTTPASWAQLLRRDALGLELLALVVECSTPRPQSLRAANDLHRLAPALEYMSTHIAEPLYHAQLAAFCGMSASRFHAVFKEVMGMAPGRYLQDTRLRKAQSLLFAGQPSVKSVAAQVGYPDEFHFSRLFHKRFGRSPSKYRQSSTDFNM
ncbi:MAG: AraC family transcriptional regulator [bacterium]